MTDRSLTANPDPTVSDGDPLLRGLRENALRAMRLSGTLLAIVSGAVLAARLLGVGTTGGPGGIAILVAAMALGVISWVIPRHRLVLMGATVVAMLIGIATVGLWSVGPSLPLGALMVMVPLLTAFFFGRRKGVVAGAAVGVILAAVGLASWLVGRPFVGTIPGARVPYPVYVELAIMTAGNVAIALAVVYANLGAVEASLRRAREAAERERLEQQRRAEAERSLAQAQRLEAIGHLAGGVAHDTRNALVVMSAGLAELRRGVRSPEDREVLADLEHAVSNLTHTAQQLLSLGRRPSSAARPVALSEVVAPFTSALRRVIPPEVALRLENECDVRVHLDPARLEQALLNLALNARDAMPAGGALTLRVARRTGPDGDHAVVELEDTGNGMDAPTAARIFEPFFTTKPVGSGTGLGLSIVQGFVAEAGGTIEVDSAVGRGTRVRLSFPAVPGGGAQDASTAAGG